MDSQTAWGDSSTQFFTALGPDKVLDVAERFGLKCTGRSMALNSMENRVYQVEIDTTDELSVSDPARYRIIKFYRPGRWSFEQIADEHQFLFDLASEEYPVACPVRFDEEHSIYLDKETNLMAALFPKIGGRNVDELKDSQLGIVGRLLARLHVIGKKRESLHRLHLDCQTYGDQNLDAIISANVLSTEHEKTYIDLVEDLLDMIEPLMENIAVQRVHGDCHLGNLLDGASGLFWVDFDDMVVGPPVQDIWLVESGRDDYSKRRQEVILGAYETFKTFDYSSLKLIEPLRTLRMVHFSAWIGKRYQDQAFKRAFPDYGTSEYWADEITSLREQAELISGMAL
ncbi:MAG TPA: serine/threonine protein kinase [Oligoflexia bacterium]|nr:serine/threonine protein kinase [Oligoflexia bacterium]HMP48621.1 serine/threonine protein kinase [Oligoflexia bacterium]